MDEEDGRFLDEAAEEACGAVDESRLEVTEAATLAGPEVLICWGRGQLRFSAGKREREGDETHYLRRIENIAPVRGC